MKNIILTLDYELFLNQSGTIKNCILNPVSALSNTLDKHAIKAVFFIDILYLHRLKTENLSEEFKLVKNDVQNLIRNGHQIELHLHPHWIDAKYDSESSAWDLSNYTNYRLHALDKQQLENVFNIGYELLLEIGKEVDNQFSLNAFRAGGLCIQPFSKIKPLLLKHDIRIDSSVAPTFSSDSKTHFYNFVNAPLLDQYSFSDDPCLQDNSGEFKEFPVLHYKKSFFHKVLSKIKGGVNTSNKIFGDGKAASPQFKGSNSILNKFKSDKYLFSLDGDYDEPLLLKKIKSEKNPTITILSHPKLMSPQSLKTIDKLVQAGYKFNQMTTH